MGVDHFQAFKKDFNERYFQDLINPQVQLLATMTQADFFSQPHQLFHGHDLTLTRMLLDAVLHHVMGAFTKREASIELVVGGSKCSMPFKHSSVHVEVDLDTISSGERQLLTEFIHKHLGATRTVNTEQQKRIVVLHGIENSACAFALRKVLETCSKNVLFLLTARNVSKVNEAIKSRCALVRCGVTSDRFDAFCQRFMGDHGIEEAEVDRSDTVTYTILNFGSTDGDGVDESIKAHLQNMVEASFPAALKSNRDFAFKMLHFHIPIAHIFKRVIRFCQKRKLAKHRLLLIVDMAASLEHKSTEVSKPSMPIERLLLEVWRQTNAT
jgi:hypothetical protein